MTDECSVLRPCSTSLLGLLLGVLALFASTGPVRAASCELTTLEGGTIQSLSLGAGGHLYAGSESAGPFRGQNLGTSWSALRAGLLARGSRLNSQSMQTPGVVAASPFHGDRAYFSSDDLYLTEDGGQTWARLDFNKGIRAIVFDSSDPDRQFFGTRQGVYETTDGSKSFERLPLLDDDQDPIGALDLIQAGTDLYATRSTVFKSSDGGQSWISFEEALGKAGFPFGTFSQIVARSGLPETLFVRVSNGLGKTVDGGATWTNLTSAVNAAAPGFAAEALAISPSGQQILLAGHVVSFLDQSVKAVVLRSTDGGVSWTAVSTSLRRTVFLDLLFLEEQIVLAATRRGILRSDDGGSTWIPVNNGLDAASLDEILETGSARLVARNFQADLFESVDGGVTWTPLAAQGLASPFSISLAAAPSNPERLYLNDGLQISRSDDGGESWAFGISDLDPNLTLGFALRNLLVHPENADVVFLSVSGQPNTPGNFSGIYRSTDAGVTWTRVHQPSPFFEYFFPLDFAIDPQSSSILYLTANVESDSGHNGVVMRSSDGGLSWVPVFDEIGQAGITVGPSKVYAYSARREAPSRDGGVYASEDGLLWTPINGGLPAPADLWSFSGLTVDPAAGETLRVFSSDRRALFVKPDGAGSWTQELTLPPYQRALFHLVRPTEAGSEILVGGDFGLCRIEPALLFADGFESGSLSRWGSASP